MNLAGIIISIIFLLCAGLSFFIVDAIKDKYIPT